jgi:urease beta subunit
VNKLLSFDRELAYGMHLDIPSGTAVRFEPGEEKEVTLVEFAGKQRVFGLNNLTCGHCSDDTKNTSIDKAVKKGFIKKER